LGEDVAVGAGEGLLVEDDAERGPVAYVVGVVGVGAGEGDGEFEVDAGVEEELAVERSAGLGDEGLHHVGGHADAFVGLVEVNFELEAGDDGDEGDHNHAAAAAADAGDLALALEGEGGGVFEGVEGVEARLFGDAVDVVIFEVLQNLIDLQALYM
jgi:hypothetical protein